jgi:hypothetical protein
MKNQSIFTYQEKISKLTEELKKAKEDAAKK